MHFLQSAGVTRFLLLHVSRMFFLKKQSCGTTGGSCNGDCDEFGWWLIGSNPGKPADEDDVPKSDCTGSPRSTVCYEESEYDDPVDKKEVSNDELQPVHPSSPVDDPDGICLAEEPPCGTCSRSYTPERLIRNRDYRILTQSPTTLSSPRTGPSTPCKRYASKRNRRLSSLIDQQLVGASQLEALLDPHVLNIKLPAVPGRRKGFAGRLAEGYKNASRSSGDLLAFANSESPPGILTPDLTSSESSCETLNCEWRRRSEADVSRIGGMNESLAALASVTPRKVCRRLVSTPQNLRSDENSYEDLPGHDVLRADSWGKGRVVHFFPEKPDDPERVVRKLRERIDYIRDTNRDISKDLSSLRKNYEWAEQKTGNLTTATTELRKEIRDLRYIDDLVNLLRGELKRISQRNWPFNLGHTEHHMEEINLVI